MNSSKEGYVGGPVIRTISNQEISRASCLFCPLNDDVPIRAGEFYFEFGALQAQFGSGSGEIG
jgi:hypothetical protein